MISLCSCFDFTVGAEADEKMIEYLLNEVKGKDITELIAAGRSKLASVPSGGGAAAYSAAPAAGAGAAAPAAAEAKEEKKVEEKEESDDVSLFLYKYDQALFFFMYCFLTLSFGLPFCFCRTWVSVSSTKSFCSLKSFFRLVLCYKILVS